MVSFVFAFRAMAYCSTPEYTLHYGFRLVLAAPSYREILKLKHWMDEIVRVPKGRDTLWAISRSNHDLVIRHSSFAVIPFARNPEDRLPGNGPRTWCAVSTSPAFYLRRGSHPGHRVAVGS